MNNSKINYINECIREMMGLLEMADQSEMPFLQQDLNQETPFVTNHRAIRRAFTCGDAHCESVITKDAIYRQLALIDLFYSTNVHRMFQFGLEELRDEIWDLCASGTSVHTLGNLSRKLTATAPLNIDIKAAFGKKYGYASPTKQVSAPSLLSKYFHFVTIVCPTDNWGFPIYDSIVYKLLRRLQRFIGIPLTPDKFINQSLVTFDIDQYVDGLKRIIDALESRDPSLWNSSGWQKFALLDCFLWHIGKAGSGTHSSLLTKKEYISGVTPGRITKWATIYKTI